MIRKNTAGKSPARKGKTTSSSTTSNRNSSQSKTYRSKSEDSNQRTDNKSPRTQTSKPRYDSKGPAPRKSAGRYGSKSKDSGTDSETRGKRFNSDKPRFDSKGVAPRKSASRYASRSEDSVAKTERRGPRINSDKPRFDSKGAAPRKSTSRVGSRATESRGSKRDIDSTKKPYGAASTYNDRKKLKSLSEAKPTKEKYESEDKPERVNRSRPTTNFDGPKGKGKFTKKNELKGFKPKIGANLEEDFRFKKPGSRGKQLIVEEQQELGKGKLKGNTKEWVTENALKKGEEIRINRYISNAGVCSRREADELIAAGLVSVNGQVVTELGQKVKSGDVVRFNGEKLNVEAKVYLILNKPKDAITTSDDPEGRNTVMDLFEGKLQERIYPVGRLDRNTTGVLLLTNDGEMSQRLMHPKYEVKKVYKATLNKIIKPTDLWTLANGVELEDGFIKPDALGQPDPKDKAVVGVEIHSGKNRIIHRIFEHLGYTVDRLDRILYAGLAKGKLKRGEWRELTEKELKQLKRMVHMK